MTREEAAILIAYYEAITAEQRHVIDVSLANFRQLICDAYEMRNTENE